MTRLERWYAQDNHIAFAKEILGSPLFQEALGLLRESGWPVQRHPDKMARPMDPQQAADAFHWREGYFFALAAFDGLKEIPKPMEMGVDPGEWDHFGRETEEDKSNLTE